MKKWLALCVFAMFMPIFVFSQAGVNLDTALGNSAANLRERIPSGSKVVVLNFSSNWPQLSEYIIEELIGYLVNAGNLTVVDRHNLETIRQEMNFQLSGDVSDETAQSIGRMLGAQTIVSGAIMLIGNTYRLRVRAIVVETAQILAMQNTDVVSDSRLAALTQTASSSVPTQPAIVLPDIVRNARRYAPEGALIGIGSRHTGNNPAMINQSRSLAENRAKLAICNQMIAVFADMFRDFTASNNVNAASARSFEENVSRSLTQSRLPGVRVNDEDLIDGTYFVVVYMGRAEVFREINQAIAAAKLAVPALAYLNFNDSAMDAAYQRALGREIPIVSSE